jgi:hypothetical protein
LLTVPSKSSPNVAIADLAKSGRSVDGVRYAQPSEGGVLVDFSQYKSRYWRLMLEKCVVCNCKLWKDVFLEPDL